MTLVERPQLPGTLSKPNPHRSSGAEVVRQVGAFAFVVPYLIAFAFFLAYPIVYGIVISLHHWNPMVGAGAYVGLGQYALLFNFNDLATQTFWQSIGNTSLFVVISVPLLVGIPLALAYLIYLAPAKSIFRPVFFFPAILSATSVMAIWAWMLQTEGGPINGFFGLHIPWLVRQPWAWVSIDLVTVWWSIGFNLIILYAGLTQLPQSTFDAAAIDGAGVIRTFWSIIVPQLRNILSVVLILSTIASFNLFAQPFLLTGGGPSNSTLSISQQIYNQGFGLAHMGSATAMAFFMGLILAMVSFVQYGLVRQRRA
jgi:multiple sugar transport system permease protein